MKSLLISLGLCAVALPAQAVDTDHTAQEIAAMREEITALRSNMMSLNLKLADMQTMMRTMNATIQKMHKNEVAAQAAATTKSGDECTTKLSAYKTKRDKLLSLGYKPEHPDLRALSGRIEALEKECGKN